MYKESLDWWLVALGKKWRSSTAPLHPNRAVWLGSIAAHCSNELAEEETRRRRKTPLFYINVEALTWKVGKKTNSLWFYIIWGTTFQVLQKFAGSSSPLHEGISKTQFRVGWYLNHETQLRCLGMVSISKLPHRAALTNPKMRREWTKAGPRLEHAAGSANGYCNQTSITILPLLY